MKKLLFLLALGVSMGFAQIKPLTTDRNESGYLRDASSDGTTTTYTTIAGRTYNASTVDTTEWLSLTHHTTIYVSLQSKDSASILIKYQLSSDANTLGVLTTKDSLATASDAGAFKSVDMTSTALGARYIRFVFTGQAWSLGTTTPTYFATYTLKKE